MDNQTVITAAELFLKRRPLSGSVIFPTVYSTGSDCDLSNASGQKVVSVAATAGLLVAADRVVIGRDTAREEEGIIDSVDPGVSITLVDDLTYNHTVDAATTVDLESAADQKVLSVAATTDFLVGETVLVDEGETHEATYTIASIDPGVSLTMVEDLLFTHDATETVTQTGIAGVVEVAEAFLSEVIDKSHHKNIVLSLPADWTTAIITFAGCMTEDGTFLPIVNADDVGETTIASVAASMCIVLNGEIKEAMAAVPFIKLRSGVLATPVDQGAGNVSISYALTE